ncbi:MAG TPA: M3 family metallopeptidase [Candidatus Acidoferrales bacterium]|nr:M3 family metallopeptidase [Candidatus Acidoferrales bacterium]
MNRNLLRPVLKYTMWTACIALFLSPIAGPQTQTTKSAFGPSNPFYAPSTLPFHAPPFNKIKDSDYEPAMDAGIAQNLAEIDKIANDSAPATLANTFIALEKSGRLLERVDSVFNGVTGANTDPTLQKIQETEAPKLAALEDAEMLNPKLFARVKAVYNKRNSLKLDQDSMRLVERTYANFVHAGANLSDADKKRLKQINEQLASLSANFMNRLLAAAKAGGFATTDKSKLAGLTDEQLAAAQSDAKAAEQAGYLIPLQNTTQQPLLTYLTDRKTREAIFSNSWNRAEHGDANDTRDTIAQIAKLRAEKSKLLGYPTFAAWEISDQMAKTPAAVMHFLDSLTPAATANANAEAKEIQGLIDAQHGGFTLAPYDWNLYVEQLRKQKYGVDEAAVRPYFELNRVLEDGVFYAATQLYGITFHERHDIPVYNRDVRVFQVNDAGGKPLALFYCDFFKRDNKQGGAWTDGFVTPSKLLDRLPVVYNVENFAKPAPGQPALLSYDDVSTMFHEFGHALNGMFYNGEYPSLYSLGGDIPRDFVEFPSQFNEHWRDDPTVFAHFARNYKTGAPMPEEMAAKLRASSKFNQGYALTELLAAAELDMQWHLLPADAPVQNPDSFEKAALEKTHLWLSDVPPRYRSSYFLHIWANGYEAGYYAYLWSEMLDDDAYAWFTEHGGLTRSNGERFRKMILSRGRTPDMEALYEAWRGAPPTPDALLRQRGLKP